MRGTVRQLDALVKDEPVDWLKGRKIGDAIADLEKRLQEKHGPAWPIDRPTISQQGVPASDTKKGVEVKQGGTVKAATGGEVKKSGEASKASGSPSVASRASMFGGKGGSVAPSAEKEKPKDAEKDLVDSKKRVEAEIGTP